MSRSSVTAETIFGKAIDLADAGQRASFLDQACGDDRSLRDEVDRLVRDHFLAGDFLEKPAVAVESTSPLLAGDQIGSLIGPYKLLEQIGEGGMGVVYMAEQQRPIRRLVALKLIKPGMDSRQVTARFEAERQALAMMDHPNIAKVLDAGTTGEPGAFARGGPQPAYSGGSTARPYFVMELV